jgi:hypothetical protein
MGLVVRGISNWGVFGFGVEGMRRKVAEKKQAGTTRMCREER